MLRTAVAFFLIGIIAFGIGAGNIGILSMEVGRLLLQIFVVLAVISLLASIFTGRAPRLP
jgi:uncharacterized membrane protein YtjA (UPF0391 family)